MNKFSCFLKDYIIKCLHSANIYVVEWQKEDEPRYQWHSETFGRYSHAMRFFHNTKCENHQTIIFARREAQKRLILGRYSLTL